MKKIFFLIGFLFTVTIINAQSIQQAKVVAQKMKDSLALSSNQSDSIYKITVRLLSKKIITQDPSNPSAIIVKKSFTEILRDSLYRNVLTDGQFILYKEKKQNLIENN